MSFKIFTITVFEKQFKKLLNKYPSIKSDLSNIIEMLKENPKYGKSIGHNCYKIRIAIKSKHLGKSGGARLLTYIKFIEEKVFLISIYDKSEIKNISESEIKMIVKSIDEIIS